MQRKSAQAPANKVIGTREELYAAVWETPMLDVAKQLGIKSRALVVICQRLDIPYPKRGYWQKRRSGTKVRSPRPLPNGPVSIPETIIRALSLRRIGPTAQLDLIIPSISYEHRSGRKGILAKREGQKTEGTDAWETVSAFVITSTVERVLQSPPYSLSPRETDVVKCLYEENGTPQIAARLGISPRTVEVHRASILDKKRAMSTVGLVKLLVALIVSAKIE